MIQLKATFELWLEITAWDKAGKIVHHQRQPSRSPVQQFLEAVLSQIARVNVALQDKDNATQTLDFDYGGYLMSAVSALGSDDRGIVIGTDATPVDIADYALGALIAHGSGAGELLYQAAVIDSVVTIADPDATFEMYRNFNNNSGGSITVKETGIYVQGLNVPQDYIYYCIVRDVPTELVVPDGGGCQVKYTLKITE